MAAVRRLIMNCGIGMGYWCGMDDVTRPRDDDVRDHVTGYYRVRRTKFIINCAFIKHCNEYRKKKYNDESGICEQLKRRRKMYP